MRITNTRMSGTTRTRRGLALLIASGAGIGSLLLGTVPAQANDTTKQVSADGRTVVFTTSDSSRNVSGSVEFTVNATATGRSRERGTTPTCWSARSTGPAT